MNFYLDFPDLSVFAMSRVDGQPLCKLDFKRMRLKWLRDTKFNVVIAIYSEIFNVYYYEKHRINKRVLLEKTLLGEDVSITRPLVLQGQSTELLDIDHVFVLNRQYPPLYIASLRSYGFEDSGFSETKA